MFIPFDHCIVFFLLLLSATSMNDSAALSKTMRAPNTAASTSTRAGTRSQRSRQPFKGQNHAWEMVITSDKLKASTYTSLYKRTVGMVPSICDGNLKHILIALSAGKDITFVEPSLDDLDEKSQVIFKIKYAAHCKNENTYNNNKIALATFLLGQCDDSVLHQLADMDNHATGQYDIIWVLSAINQLCSGIRNDESPLLQVVTALRKLYVTKQQENQSLYSFREEFEQNVQALRAVGAIITLPESCLELEV